MSLAAELGARLGESAVSAAEADLRATAVDLWPRHMLRMAAGEPVELPAAVVWPESVADLVTIVDFARQRGVPLVPHGAGSSVVGGASSSGGEIVVDLKRMKRLVALDLEARTVTAEAGLLGELLERRLERAGFMQGNFPSSIYCSTVGGWIGARGAGQLSSRYGKIEDQLLGGTLVLGDGQLLVQPASPVRDRRFDELVGAEGAAAIFAEAILRIYPLPETRRFVAFDFPDLDRALGAMRAWMLAGLAPAVVRLYDPIDSLLHRRAHAPKGPHDRGPNRLAALAGRLPRLMTAVGALAKSCRSIVVLEGAPAVVDADLVRVREIAEGFAAADRGAEPAEHWWQKRYALSYRQSNAFRAGVAVDTFEVAGLWERLLPTYQAVRRAGVRRGAHVMAHFSHTYREGGSIYFTFVMPLGLGTAGYDALWDGVLGAALDAGANVAHHHGVGRLKRRGFTRAVAGGAATLRALLGEHDAAGLMNAGALRPEEGSAPLPSRAASEAPGAALITAAPDERLGDIEARLRHRQESLGEIAALFPERSVIELAKRRLLWRVNPQLRTVESALAGVDAPGAAFIAAPRAAMGPDLSERLLEAGAERLWLRSESAAASWVARRGGRGECVRAVRDLLRDPQAEGARAAVYGDVVLVQGGGSPALAHLPEDSAAVPERRLEAEPLFVAGTWGALESLVDAPELEHALLALPWCDAVGAAGFVHGLSGAAERQAVARAIERAGADGRAWMGRRAQPAFDRQEAKAAKEANNESLGDLGALAVKTPFDTPGPAAAPARRLELAGDGAALDNCTFCPKLCRFACPVAVEHGGEALTPRQLMLRARLDRSGLTPLSADAAARLWACVDCRGCRSFCDHDNDVASVLMRARHEIFESGGAPPAVVAYMQALRATGAPLDWCGEEDPGRSLSSGGGRARLFVSCQSSSTDRESTALLLDLTAARFGAASVLATEPRCCGLPLWRWGDRAGFAAHARRFAASLPAGLETIVADDPGCAYALGQLYREVGVAMPPVVTARALVPPRPPREPDAPWTVHQSCWSSRWLGDPAWRDDLAGRTQRLVAGSVLEPEAGCCGGMLLPHLDPALAERVTRGTAEDLLGGGAALILSDSPTCRRRLRAVGAPVADLLTLWR